MAKNIINDHGGDVDTSKTEITIHNRDIQVKFLSVLKEIVPMKRKSDNYNLSLEASIITQEVNGFVRKKLGGISSIEVIMYGVLK